MHKLFYPESIVIIGLSSKSENIPRFILENLLRWGYKGRIFGVNPASNDVHVDGIRMYKKVEDLPEVPELACCLIPARFVPGLVEQCGRFGIKRMAIPSGGFSEFSEEGRMLAAKTLELARKYGIHFIGPNSIALINTENGLCLPFIPMIKCPRGEISIISQSGGVIVMLLNYLSDERIGLAKVASIGNKLDYDEVDFLRYFGEDPQTGIICLYLESLARGRDFLEAAKNIDKPIIAYKSNTTPAGKKAALSHTAAISNDDDLIDTVFEEAGVIRIKNFFDFIEVSKAFHLPPMKGRRIMVMGPAGGFSVMGADMCEKAGFELADMGQEFYDSLKQFSNAGVIKFSNPLDMGDIYDPKLTADVIYTAMHSDRVDGCIYISQRPEMPQGNSIFHRMMLTDLSSDLRGTILSAGKPLGVCLFGPSEIIRQVKRSVEFPIFNSPEELVKALALQAEHYEQKMKKKELKNIDLPSGIDRHAAMKCMDGKHGAYGEEIFDLLSSYGIPVAASRLATCGEDAVKAAGELGYPVVMKVVSKDALHKSDAGGVVIGVESPAEVEESFRTIRANLFNYKKDASFEGVRIQKMAPDGYDMFVGGKYDLSLGPVVFFGMGGIFIEVFEDVANALCPAGRDTIHTRLSRLKSCRVLEGLRGKAPGDINAFLELVVRVSHLLADFPAIRELDLNPVRVFPEGSGALALDARAVIDMNFR